MTNTLSTEVLTNENIKELVYEIRGQQVMLDYDLAALYGYEVKKMNQQVKRNINRFPDDFMFQLTKDEVDFVRSQFVTSPIKSFFQGQEGGRRYNPYAFTEQGIYQLATVLRGEAAEQTSILIMRVFREMRIFIKENKNLLPSAQLQALENKTYKLDERLQKVETNMITKADLSDFMKIFNQTLEDEEMLFLNGEPLKADIAYQKIFKKAKSKIFIIDDYISIKTLEHLRKSKTKITIFTDNKSNHLTHQELSDFNTEYPNLSLTFIKTNNIVHDRFIIIDYKTKNEEVWHLGASIKDSGNKITIINKVGDSKLLRPMIESLLQNPLKQI